MFGYKATNTTLKATHGNNMSFSINQWYEVNNIQMCHMGFHFCEKIEQVDHFYPLCKNRLFLIEARGSIIKHSDKNVCSHIRFLREITQKEIRAYAESLYRKRNVLSINTKLFLISYGVGLDEFRDSDDWRLRAAVATYGREADLDILVYDKNPYVRRNVAIQGRNTDCLKLLFDSDTFVQMALKSQQQNKKLILNM